jgi:hypothetical protein
MKESWETIESRREARTGDEAAAAEEFLDHHSWLEMQVLPVQPQGRAWLSPTLSCWISEGWWAGMDVEVVFLVEGM